MGMIYHTGSVFNMFNTGLQTLSYLEIWENQGYFGDLPVA